MIKFILTILFSIMTLYAGAQTKREFRGAWIQCVNGQFEGLGRDRMQQTLSHQLDELQKDGVNAIFFQVRAECDALYPSKIEPWSRFLTGQQGRPPHPYWDPLQWMIEQCHNRGMELHAWINPYRAKTKTTKLMAANHVAILHPNLVFSYDNQWILNPGMSLTREYIISVAEDIVRRYDVDGLHIDDYFYPYPANGMPIPDENLYKELGGSYATIGDWRRANVNLFIRMLGEAVHRCKPWVKFGVSPFGIYRNVSSDPDGSDTNGLQNYDDLYADVLLWVREGWVDYCVPQLYWQIGHPVADYQKLIGWWDQHAYNRPLYIGEDVVRTTKYPDPQNPKSHQLPAKHRLHKRMQHVEGTVLWYAKAVADNVGNYGMTLREHYWRFKALTPLMPFLDDKPPQRPTRVKCLWTEDGPVLFWTPPAAKEWGDVTNRYVIYRFPAGRTVDLDDNTRIVCVTYKTMFPLPYKDGQTEYTYVVTALDRVGNESKGVSVKVKL